MAIRVFISYRRKDQATLASWLHEKLSAEVDSADVFLDMKSIKPGASFPQYIRRAIENAQVYAVLIGPRWNPTLPDQSRCLDDETDWVRQEIALALQHMEVDPQRLLIPILCEGVAMPSPSELPDSVRVLTNLQSFTASGRDASAAVQGVAQRIIDRLDELDATPTEEKWVTEKLCTYLESVDARRIARIGLDMKHRFKEVTAAPESARALARVIYRIGPDALEYLVALGMSREQMESLLDLLATNWIKPEEAAKLRRNFSDAREGKRVAIECEYRDFTPDETLLKASCTELGWSSVTVKPSDGKQEIIQQIHEDLRSKLSLRIADGLSKEEYIIAERSEILKQLQRRMAEAGGARLPFVLHATPQMAKDPKLFDKIQQAFPPLHILISTHDADELRGRIGRLSPDVIMPSDSENEEQRAYDAYADAHELIVRSTRKRK